MSNNDLVSRKWLLDEYDKRHDGPPGGARKLIEEAPPVAKVRPVKHGEWMMIVDSIFNGESFVEWVCSECWYVHNRGWMHTNDGKCPGAKFCENCGADMRPEGGADG